MLLLSWPEVRSFDGLSWLLDAATGCKCLCEDDVDLILHWSIALRILRLHIIISYSFCFLMNRIISYFLEEELSSVWFKLLFPLTPISYHLVTLPICQLPRLQFRHSRFWFAPKFLFHFNSVND